MLENVEISLMFCPINTCIQSFEDEKVAVKQEVSEEVEEVFSVDCVNFACEPGINRNIV